MGLDKKGISFGEFEWYPTHSTTLRQYKEAKIINNIDYKKYEKRKPDGLIVDRRNKQDIRVIAVLEYKLPSEFQTDKQKKDAIRQCNTVCQVLNAKMGIISDKIVTYWINPNYPDKDNLYKDEFGEERNYSFILNEDKQKVRSPFITSDLPETDSKKMEAGTKDTYEMIQKVLLYANKSNSTFEKTAEVDPLNLARAVWQDIYVNTGKDPTKCLYNVVELFIFKFLSDLGVLKKPYDFDTLLRLYDNTTNKAVLEYYATVPRAEIIKLFPPGKDMTTVLNGTIFVDRNGKPVESQANLFKSSILKYAEYPSSLRNIQKEFKTKLFETFLKQSNDKSRLGQFFTPRKVIRSIVGMADTENANFICDPFCGVGGFLLEPLQMYPSLKSQFQPSISKSKHLKLLGYDKGTDEDEHRTIILAKANMMIYLSDMIEKHPTMTHAFSDIFNETFLLISDTNLGTFKYKFEKEDEKPDLILSNPPYVRKGSKTLRDEIKQEGLSNDFKDSGTGVEGLALRWIVNNLKRGGRAFIVVPNGIFDNLVNINLRASILKDCYLNLIISLPKNTFFNNTKKTYIIGIQKKRDSDPEQDFPIFTYLVSNIGETLDSNRFEIEANDLEKAKDLYNQFKGSKHSFTVDDPRCKLIDFETFEKEKYWVIEQFWNSEELTKLGMKATRNVLTIEEYRGMLGKLALEISGSEKKIKSIEQEIQNIKFERCKLTKILDIYLGKSTYTEKYIDQHQGEYPVYSAQTIDNGLIGRISTYDWDTECLTWSIDGSYPGMVFHRKGKFSMTTHCGMLRIKPEYVGTLDYDYLLNVLNELLPEFAKGEGNRRLKKAHLKQDVTPIKIPVDKQGDFDLDKQKEFAVKYEMVKMIRSNLADRLEKAKRISVQIQ